MKGRWQEVTTGLGAPQARSSHAVAVLGRKALVFGGEHQPRQPIDGSLFSFDMDTRTWAQVPASGDLPAPRIGATMVGLGQTLFVFGGRDAEHTELDELYSFDTALGKWALLSSGDSSPPARSYHAMTVDPSTKTVFVFGGCGAEGRLNDLWAFSVEDGAWRALPLPSTDSNCVPRGGAALAAVPGGVCVMFGFCGHELNDVHKYDVSAQTWTKITPASEQALWPSPRSVFGAASLPPDGRHVLVFGGEVDPSDLGHAGAGKFSDQVFVFDSVHGSWETVEVDASGGPGKRGWFAAAAVGQGMLVYGGNSEANDRLNDMFLLTLD